MKKYMCVHGHFYQPPRENPWIEAIEMQDSSYPYHDWNERICVECYWPNAVSRVLNDSDEVVKLVNNYQKMSFNFGPTLISWIREKHPTLFKNIIEADKESQALFGGHGNAIAQAYNHIILPLANSRDKYTEIYWGIKHFELYFGRKPEGFWLPETAVDLETLDILSEMGIKFTILSPHQASKIRKINTEEWQDVKNGKINFRMPYLQKLPSGRSIALFFYEGTISKNVAFDKLLQNGEEFSNRLNHLFSDTEEVQLVHIATDGETFGHHHRFGDMALAYTFNTVKEKQDIEIINYGFFLEKYPPTHEVEIFENTSWSCSHGIKRWENNCGCNGGHPEWNQKWRAPLRIALDWLRNSLNPVFEQRMKLVIKDPWMARNDYIDIINNRSLENVQRFLTKHTIHELTLEEKRKLLKWLEIQRFLLLMYTSCGWFFDEISGIETVQIIQYAARAIQLAEELEQFDLESEFLEKLSEAKSNVIEYENGKKIYEQFVKPSKVDLLKVGAHYAATSLFYPFEPEASIYCYKIKRKNEKSAESGKVKLVLGNMELISEITLDSATISYGAIHYGDQNLHCSVCYFKDEAYFQAMEKEVLDAFSKGDFIEVLKLLDKYFGGHSYSLRTLFKDEQHKVIQEILQSTESNIEDSTHQIYDDHISMIEFLKEIRINLPRSLMMVADYVINANLKNEIEHENQDFEKLYLLFEQAKSLKIKLDKPELELLYQKKLNDMMTLFKADSQNQELLKKLIGFTALLKKIDMNVDIWKAQNNFVELRDQDKNITHSEWHPLFHQLGKNLNVEMK